MSNFEVLFDTDELGEAVVSFAGPVLSPARAVNAGAEEIAEQGREAIRAGGPGWTPTMRTNHPLYLTGAMYNSIRVSSQSTDGHSAEVVMDSPGGFHVDGTPTITKRDPFASVEREEGLDAAASAMLETMFP
jgi:hypothetical protein